MELKPEEHPKGSLVLVLVFLACFAIYYLLNFKFLSELWTVG
jgi:hypothetical protein